MYLKPIFSTGCLAEYAIQFNAVDTFWQSTISCLEQNKDLLFALSDESLFPRLESKLNNIEDLLQRCQKALSEFLQGKRYVHSVL